MKIIVLDGFTLNPGDLSWDELKSSGPCDIYDRTPPEEVVRRGADADVVLTNKTPVTRDSIHALSRLKYIGVLETAQGRVAAFRDSGGDIVYGKEGDIIDGRFRLLKIGVESADLAYVDGRGRQTIRLSGQ